MEKGFFSYLIEVCLLNAYVLHKFSDEVQADFLQFRLDLAAQLIGAVRKQARGRPRSIEQTELLRLDSTKGYFPEVAPRREQRGLSKHEYRHESCVKCSVCEVHLCLNEKRNCYKIYHTELEYWKYAFHIFLIEPTSLNLYT